MNLKFKVVRISDEGLRLSCFVDGDFEINYSNGSTISAPKNTLGIMVFKRLQDVHLFNKMCLAPKRRVSYSDRKYEVLRVKGIGRGHTPKVFLGHFGDVWLKSVMRHIQEYGRIEGMRRVIGDATNELPIGTICYQKIEIINSHSFL